jgi:hypothetical protein
MLGEAKPAGIERRHWSCGAFVFAQYGADLARAASQWLMMITRLANALPNLQLLEGTVNIEKRAALPDAWLRERYPTESDREHYRSIHLLGVVPEGIEGCEEFWAARRERLREKITAMLNPMALQTSQKVQEQDAAEIGRRRAPRQAGA